MTGYLVSSKAGHDKGRIYVITAEDDEYVWIADGKHKTSSNPKKKKKKHVQIIKVYENEGLRQRLIRKEDVSDDELRGFINEYQQKQSKE